MSNDMEELKRQKIEQDRALKFAVEIFDCSYPDDVMASREVEALYNIIFSRATAARMVILNLSLSVVAYTEEDPAEGTIPHVVYTLSAQWVSQEELEARQRQASLQITPPGGRGGLN